MGGWLQALDPRSKLALIAAGLMLAFRSDAPRLALLAAAAIALLLSSRLSPRRVLSIGTSLAPLITLVFITWPLFYSRGDDVWFAWSIVCITLDGAAGGVKSELRAWY